MESRNAYAHFHYLQANWDVWDDITESGGGRTAGSIRHIIRRQQQLHQSKLLENVLFSQCFSLLKLSHSMFQ